jgi:hypothetical protein
MGCGEATDSINQAHALKSQLGAFLRSASFLAVSFIANKLDPHVLRVFSVVRLLQAENGWLAFINELGFGSAMVCRTVPRFVCESNPVNLPS